MATEQQVERTGFHRDRLTFAFYGSFVMWGWVLYSFNPSVTLLADDFGISLAQAGLHGTAMAAGGIVAALVMPALVSRTGRRGSLYAGCAAAVVGTTALVLAPSLAWSLPSMLVLAFGGNVAISAAQPGLAIHHGAAASAAVTEANGVGSTIGLVGPLAVGASVAVGWGWRPAVGLTILIAGATVFLVSRLPGGGAMTPPAVDALAVTSVDFAAAPGGTSGVSSGRRALNELPAWCFLAAVVAAITLEMSTTYWSTDLVREQTGAGAGIATATTAGLLVGMSAVRFVMGPLSLRIAPARILAAGFLVAIGGWAVLWTATTPATAIVGLVVAGVGYGVQYPLAIALLIAAARGASDAAQARATLASGLAVGVAPFALGALADAVGIHTAFAFLPVAALLGCAAAVVGGRLVRPARV